jgi:hypothetical protein
MSNQPSHGASATPADPANPANGAGLRGAGLRRPLWFILAAGAFLCIASLACSVGQAVVGRPEAGATATKTKQPTFTPLPGARNVITTPAALVRGELPPGVTVEAPGGNLEASGQFSGTLSLTPGAAEGMTSLVLFATPTAPPSPTPEPTSTPGPTPPPTVDVETNRPTRAAGPRALPTPYVVVNSATINGRRGPGQTFERLGEASKGAELMVMARTTDGMWWQVCCLANQPVWVSADLVTAKGPVDAVPELTPPPTPPPAPRPPPPPTPPPTTPPLPPFDIARGPERYVPRDDGRLILRAKVYEGKAPYEKLLPGYVVKISRDGVDVTQLNEARDYPSSRDVLDYTNFGKTGNYEYNYKFEMAGGGEADWEIYLAKPDGYRVSPITKFTTKGDLYQNLEVYIAYWLAR